MVSLGANGVDPERSWSLTPGDAADITLLYQIPSFRDASTDRCATSTTPVVVHVGALVPGAAPGDPASSNAVGRLLAAIVVLALVLAGGGLVRHRRRRSRGRRSGAAPAALVVTAVILGYASVAPPVLAQEGGGFAGPAELTGPGDACLGEFRQAGDPAGVLAGLDPSTITLVLPKGRGDEGYSTAAGGSSLAWDPNAVGRFVDGAAVNPCSTMYHELFHAKQYRMTEVPDFDECSIGDVAYHIPVKEVEAVRAENRFRAQVEGLDQRTKYGGEPLPPAGQDCDSKEQEDQHRTERDTHKGTSGSGGGGGGGGGADPSSGDRCSVRCGGTYGDPHMTTFDGVAYDTQNVGEFVLVRARDGGGLQVQARQQSLPGSRTATINAMLGFDVEGDHFTIEPAGESPILRLGDELTTVGTDGVHLPHGGALTSMPIVHGSSITVRWPDGTSAVVSTNAGYGLAVVLALAPARAGHVEGLLGNANGDDRDDLVAGGRPLPVDKGGKPTPPDVHDALADAWRVDGSSSLLHYRAAESSDTFTDRTFPVGAPPSPSPEQRRTAEAVCRAHGVEAGAPLDACVLDVMETGEADFGAAAARTQDEVGAVAVGGGAATTATVAPATTAPPELVDAGTAAIGPGQEVRITGDADHDHQSRFVLTALGPTVLWLRAAPGCDTTLQLEVTSVGPPSQLVVITRACGPGARVVLPAAGDWAVRPVAGAVGHFTTIVAGRPPDGDFGLTLGRETTGEIATAGSEDVYHVDAHRGDAYFFAASAQCPDPGRDLRAEIRLGAVPIAFEPLCRAVGRVEVRGPDGTLDVVVGGDVAVGRYAFTVSLIPPDDRFAVHDGDHVGVDRPAAGAGRIEAPGARDLYAIDAEQGQTVEVVPDGGCDAATKLELSLLAADGTIQGGAPICRGLTVASVRSSGVYTVRVAAHADAGDTGEYGFTVRVHG